VAELALQDLEQQVRFGITRYPVANEIERVAQRGKGVAKLMAQHRQELGLRPIAPPELCLDLLEAPDEILGLGADRLLASEQLRTLYFHALPLNEQGDLVRHHGEHAEQVLVRMADVLAAQLDGADDFLSEDDRSRERYERQSFPRFAFLPEDVRRPPWLAARRDPSREPAVRLDRAPGPTRTRRRRLFATHLLDQLDGSTRPAPGRRRANPAGRRFR